MKNSVSAPNIFRPFRAGHGMNMFLGLKPQAESYCPFGADAPNLLKVNAYGALPSWLTSAFAPLSWPGTPIR